MRRSKFTEAQIIKILKEHAAGLSAGSARPLRAKADNFDRRRLQIQPHTNFRHFRRRGEV